MDERDEALIKSLLEKDENLRNHWTEHIDFERQIEELNRRVYLTPAEEMERKRLQKLKLAGRDKMEQILARYR
jgi:hypothetical protein